jgi:hypothetical protein
MWDLWWKNWQWYRLFLQVLNFSLFSTILPRLYTRPHLHAALTVRTNGWTRGTLKHKSLVFKALNVGTNLLLAEAIRSKQLHGFVLKILLLTDVINNINIKMNSSKTDSQENWFKQKLKELHLKPVQDYIVLHLQQWQNKNHPGTSVSRPFMCIRWFLFYN